MKLRALLLPVLAVLALAFTGTAQAQAPTPRPADCIRINYHRPDNNYDKWGIHLWKSPNMPLPDIEWPTPMVPTGKSDFGVYWDAKTEEFTLRSKKIPVNYIIHKGDIKEQGGKDMQFDGTASKEVWINAGDRVIYTTLEEAKAAPSFK